eukprot:PhF_6_TR39623/c0_g1_i1/m.58702
MHGKTTRSNAVYNLPMDRMTVVLAHDDIERVPITTTAPQPQDCYKVVRLLQIQPKCEAHENTVTDTTEVVVRMEHGVPGGIGPKVRVVEVTFSTRMIRFSSC